ncbi:MAG: DinB family protein [Actinomycetes bacterium]
MTQEHADLLQSLGTHRFFLRQTVRDLTDEQARRRSTVSELNLASLIKHVAAVEDQWVRFILQGPAAIGDFSPERAAAYASEWVVRDDETLVALLARYEQVARHTDEVLASLPDLDAAHPLPSAPWFQPGATWSARRVLLHIIAETSQHAGHADIIREAVDGAKTMG